MSRFRFAVRAFALGTLVLALSACTMFQRIVDRFSPPATFTDLQYASVQDNVEQASDFAASVGAYVSAETLDEVLRNEVKAGLIASSEESIRFDTLEPRLVLAPQGIILTVSFDGLERKNRVRVKGTVQGFAAVATADDRLLIRPALGPFKLTKLQAESGGSVRPDVALLVNAAVKAFADNAAGHFKDRPITVTFGWQSALKADVEKLNDGNVVRVEAQVRTVELKLAKSLVHIDHKGIRVLAQVDKNVTPTSNHGAGRNALSGGGISEREFKRIFEQYSETFATEWQESLDPLAAAEPVEVYVSKAAVAGLINDVSDQNLGFEYQYNVPPTRFNEVVEAKKSQVQCQKVYEPFKRSRYQRAGCDWSCRVSGPFGTSFDDPFCKSSRSACNVKEEAKVAKDNIEYELELAQHKVDQEVRVAACNTWRETTSVLAVGRFAGDFKTAGKVDATTSGIEVDPTLSYIDIKDLGVRVGGNFDLDMRATPHDLGHVFFCVAPTRFDYRGRYVVSIPTSTKRISLTQQSDGDDLVLRAQLPSIDYEAGVTPPPVQAFVGNPEFLAKCPFAATVLLASVSTAKVAGVLGLKEGTLIYDAAMGRYDGVQALGIIEHRLKPQKVVLSEQRSIVIVPAAGVKSFQLRAKPAP